MNRATTPDLERHLTDADLVAALHRDVRARSPGRRRGRCRRSTSTTPAAPSSSRTSRGLPEYYPTRTERALLHEHAGDVARLSGADTLVELGSGSSEKTRLLLDALQAAGSLSRYVPVDVSDSAVVGAVRWLAHEYPSAEVTGVVADLDVHIPLLPAGGRRLAAFLGGTIGNLDPAGRARFLRAVRDWLAPGDSLLLGTDLVKDEARLVAAYDDAAGVTADFNRNVMRVLARELGADVEAEEFEHVAAWDAEQQWIEMRLRTPRARRVSLPALDMVVDLAAGEEIRTEISAKLTPDRVREELAAAGFDVVALWTAPDPEVGGDGEDFALTLARAA